MRIGSLFIFILFSFGWEIALAQCTPATSCQSESKSCQSTCGPGNPASGMDVTSMQSVTNSHNNNAASGMAAAGGQQQALAAAQGYCDAAKGKATSTCQQVIAANSDPKCTSQKQAAEQAKQSCEQAANSFKSQTGQDMDASKLMEALSQMAKKQAENEDQKLPEEEKEQTECEKLENFIARADSPEKKRSLQNLHDEKCQMKRKQVEGKDPKNKKLRNQETADVRGPSKLSEEELERADKQAFIRKMLNCDQGSSLKECCDDPANERFCASQNIEGASGVTSDNYSGGGSANLGSSSAGKTPTSGKLVDSEIAASKDKKDRLPTVDISFEGGGGGSPGSGGGLSYGDDSDDSSASVPRPTKANVKLAAAKVDRQRKQLGDRTHDMFGAVTQRIRQSYMKGKLIQTKGVLFRPRP